MSAIFKVLKRYKVESSPNIRSLERICSLPNIYMHLGEVPYSWYPIFFEKILRPISFGYDVQTDIGYSFDVNNAITVSMEDLDLIQKEILEERNNATELITCNPECRLLA